MMKMNISNFYLLFNVIFIILYICSFFNLFYETTHYLYILNEVYKVFIGGVLLYVFNPWSKKKFDKIHTKIAFSAGLLLIFTSSITGMIKYIPVIRKIPYINKIKAVKNISLIV